ncbi:MAG: metal-dependent transcriptional regulator [Chloroflexi bacterium]|nr:metal-dependent transcriptional regulator [Chloroflexota bacterium]
MAEQEKRSGPRLTQAMENYLLSIYVVLERGGKVSNSNLVDQLRRVPASENLGTSLPAVSGMLRRMEKESLIRLGDSRDIDLTPKGRGLAESMIRKHRLAARMVVDLLNVPLHEVDAEAHMLEHALSDSLEKRIQEKLGNPKTDPFGQPIPGSGYREPKGIVTLDKAPVGVPMVVDRIPEDDAELVAYLYESGVLPDVQVIVADVAPYRGVVTLKIGDEIAVLGYNVSSEIRLREI